MLPGEVVEWGLSLCDTGVLRDKLGPHVAFESVCVHVQMVGLQLPNCNGISQRSCTTFTTQLTF
jgi:hypothetical protein